MVLYCFQQLIIRWYCPVITSSNSRTLNSNPPALPPTDWLAPMPCWRTMAGPRGDSWQCAAAVAVQITAVASVYWKNQRTRILERECKHWKNNFAEQLVCQKCRFPGNLFHQLHDRLFFITHGCRQETKAALFTGAHRHHASPPEPTNDHFCNSHPPASGIVYYWCHLN